MSIRYEERYGRAGYDIRFPKLGIRERCSFPEEVRTEAARKRYAETRASSLLKDGKPEPQREAATFEDFTTRWMRDYVRAEGLKPSTVDSYERILRLHLVPAIGTVRLDAIGPLQVQKVKLRLEGKADKTRACVLSLLSEMLGAAEEWKEIARAPRIALPSFMTKTMEFYDFAEWDQLIAGARRAGPMQLAALLLGGDAGLRRGELVALEQTDVGAAAITVQRNDWKGKVGKPKGGKSRRVPMTARLREAIAAVRHLRGARLLWQANGRRVGIATLQSWMETSCRRAGLPPSRNLHKLRHTFCSHLAMRGVPAKVIQEWAGHADLATTMRYMHLSPGATDSMIRVLEEPFRAGTIQGLQPAER
jgi:integrase